MIIRIFIFVALYLLTFTADAIEQDETVNTWVQVPGIAIDIAANAGGQVYVISNQQQPWRWDNTQKRWRLYSGKFESIAAAEANFPWALNEKNELYRFNGLWWEIKNTDVSEVTANERGQVFIVKKDGTVQRWYALRSEWQKLKGKYRNISVDSNGKLWGLDKNAHLHGYNGKKWQLKSPLEVREFSVINDDTIAIVDSKQKVHIWSQIEPKKKTSSGSKSKQNEWIEINDLTNVRSIALTGKNKIWALLTNKTILTNDLDRVTKSNFQAHKAIAKPLFVKNTKTKTIRTKTPKAKEPKVQAVRPEMPTAEENNNNSNVKGGNEITIGSASESANEDLDPATITTKQEIRFGNTSNDASLIAIGGDGSIFGLAEGGSILRWSNSESQFNDFPGALARLAVDRQGNPWGISSLGRIFRHTGKRWEQIQNATASDISISYNDRVIVSDADGKLFEFNDELQRFSQIFGTNVALVAVAPDGTPWTIRSDKLVQRCNESSCQIYPQRAKSIAIGPDNSLYIVSVNQTLLRLNRFKDEFELVKTEGFNAVDQVAVGPMGFPWIIDSNNRVLASKFFERNEHQDRFIATITPENGTVGSGESEEVVSSEISEITFSKNMRFQNIPNTVPIGEGDFNILEVGNDGNIWASVVSLPPTSFEKYNTERNRFELFINGFSNNNLEIAVAFDVTSSGDFWIATGSNLYRVRGLQVKDFTFISGTYEDVSIGGDDSIYVLINNQIFVRPPGANLFTPFSNDTNVSQLSAGRAGDIWIIDASETVKQWNGEEFENRPKGRTQLASSVKAGKGGAVYITNAIPPLAPFKWNATNNSFDRVNNANLDFGAEVAVEADGRLWVLTPADNTIKRAKD